MYFKEVGIMKRLTVLFLILVFSNSLAIAQSQNRSLQPNSTYNPLSNNKTYNSGYENGYNEGYKKKTKEYESSSNQTNNRFYTDSNGRNTDYYRY